MYFERKAYNSLLEWKKHYSGQYAVLLEGARRVGKSTIAENFAKNEYKSYILIDFSKTTNTIRECFDDIGNLDMFFLRLQAETGVKMCIRDRYKALHVLRLLLPDYPRTARDFRSYMADSL